MFPWLNGQWVTQLARNLTDVEGSFLSGSRYLILDRDPLFRKSFQVTLVSFGIPPIRLPARSPNLNANAERFARSIKSDSLGQVIPFSERHLRHVMNEYTEHYHRERNHHGLSNELIDRRAEDYSGDGPIERRERLGGYSDTIGGRLRCRPGFGTIKDLFRRPVILAEARRHLPAALRRCRLFWPARPEACR